MWLVGSAQPSPSKPLIAQLITDPAINTQNQSVAAADSQRVHISRQMGRRQEWPFVLLFRMDFLFFREREGAHLAIRSWAEIVASGSLAQDLTCLPGHAVPVSRRPLQPGLHKW